MLGLVLGMGAGAAGLSVYQASAVPAAEARLTSFVEVRRMTVPLITEGGALDRYVAIDFALEVGAERRAHVRHRLPDVRHHVNAAAHAAPLSLGGDGRVDIEAARALINAAATRALPGEEMLGVQIMGVQPI